MLGIVNFAFMAVGALVGVVFGFHYGVDFFVRTIEKLITKVHNKEDGEQ